MSALVVGLTGGIGSGKSTVAKLFDALGVEIIDADELAREVVLPGSKALAEIARHFGHSLLDTDGALNRSELRRIVFANDNERRWLEQLLHPLIHVRMQERLTGCRSSYCILASPLLLETEQVKLVDRVLVVDVSLETQLRRTAQRDGSDPATIKGIIDAQIERAERLRRANDVIDNEQEPGKLAHKVQRLHDRYLSLAKEK